jgi:hypothetical protein
VLTEHAFYFAESPGVGVLGYVRPFDPSNTCNQSASTGETTSFQSSLASSAGAAYLSSSINLRAHIYDVTTFNSAWMATMASGVSSRPVVAYAGAVLGTGVTPSGTGGAIFTYDNLGVLSWLYPSNLASIGAPGGLAIGAGPIAFFGTTLGPSGGPALMRMQLNGTSPTHSLATGAPVLATPVIGQDRTLYAVTRPGTIIAARSSDLTELWRFDLNLAAADGGVGQADFDTHPTLDCARSGKTAVSGPGTLYFLGNANGRAYAVIVDSHGLDPSAPWPKFQREARNTGNDGTPILACP